jgi:hypothetical protein
MPVGSLASELSDLDDTARGDLAGCFAHWQSYLELDSPRCASAAPFAPMPTKKPRHRVMTALQGGPAARSELPIHTPTGKRP